MAAPGSIYEKAPSRGPLRQGEIVGNLLQITVAVDTIGSDEIAVTPVVHPYAIVVSQDCDLEGDWRERERGSAGNNAKLMSNVLFCDVYTATHVRQAPGVNRSAWNYICTNRDIRYQFLQKVEPEQDLTVEGLPEMVVDFKRYFAMPTDEVYARFNTGELQRRCFFHPPYLQHLATRFYYYQYRVALPEQHFSD